MFVAFDPPEEEDESETWPFASAFRRADVASLLRPGANELEVRLPASEGAAEAPILAGDFAVALDDRGQASLVPEPPRLSNGSWTGQGYPFYAGRMRYLQDFLVDMEPRKRYFISLHPHCTG